MTDVKGDVDHSPLPSPFPGYFDYEVIICHSNPRDIRSVNEFGSERDYENTDNHLVFLILMQGASLPACKENILRSRVNRLVEARKASKLLVCYWEMLYLEMLLSKQTPIKCKLYQTAVTITYQELSNTKVSAVVGEGPRSLHGWGYWAGSSHPRCRFIECGIQHMFWWLK